MHTLGWRWNTTSSASSCPGPCGHGEESQAFSSLLGSEDAHRFLASPPPHPLFCSGCCTAPLASAGRCVIAGAVVPIPPGPPDTQPCHRELCSLQGSSAHRAGYGLLTFPDVFGGERVCPLFLCPSSRSFYSWFLRLTHVKLHLNSLAPEDLRVHSPHCGGPPVVSL